MSKKILKRSLALGALMAFVITGSAMAAEEIYIASSTVTPVFDKSVAGGIDLTNYVVNENTITTNETQARIYGINVDAGVHTIELKDVSKITINADTEQARAVRVNGSEASFSATKSLELNATTNTARFAVGYATYDNNLTSLNDINIVANNINTDNKGCNVNSYDAWQAARAIGIDIENSRKDNVVNGKAYVTAKGNAFTQGIYLYQANLTFKDYAEIVAESTRVTGYDSDARAINLEDWASGIESSLTFEKDAVIKAIAANGKATAILASGNDNLGVNFNGEDTQIIVESKLNSIGMYVTGQADVMSEGKVTIEATTENGDAYGIVSAQYKDAAVGSQTAGHIELTGDTKIVVKSLSGDEAVAVWARPSDSPAANIVIGGNDKKVEIIGDVKTQGGSVSTTLGTADSYLNGAVITAETDATTNLKMVEGATWNVTGDSVVTNVEGDGTIKLDMVSENAVATVNAGSISETTTVGATGAVTDYIAGLSETEQTAVMQDVVNAVKVGENTFTDTVTTDEGLIAGSYTLTKNTDGTVTSTQAANQTNTAIGESAVALKAHWRAHMNDMNKRMGELRFANGETGVWTRMVRGEAEYAGVKAQYNQYQLGYDEKLSVDKRWTVGAAVTFSEGDSNFYKGSTEDDSTAFAIYGSKLNNDGTFVDLIARYAHLESDITTATDKSDYSTNGMSVSAEFGKRIQQGNGMWIEPQVELTYGSVDSAEYVLDGKKVQVGDMDSLIGRVGFSIGKDIEKGNVYARASYLYDFDGETETSFSAGGLNDTIKEDLGGGWWEVGVGANINLSKATYIYADIEKTFGGEVDTNWQWNLGVRYSF